MNQKIETSWNELWPTINVLNEICNGINMNKLKDGTILNFAIITKLIKKLSTNEKLEEESDAKIIIEVNKIETELIISCFNEVLKQIEEWEFQTRIGICKPEAVLIKEKFLSDLGN